MIFIAATDLHISLLNPVARKDNYFEEIIASLEYVLDYADSVGAEAVLLAGDFFDKPVQCGTVMRTVIEVIRKHKTRIITTVGQHDTNGHNPSLYRIKSLGILEAAGCLDVLISGEQQVFGDVVVRGFAFNEIETEEFLNGTEDFMMEDNKTYLSIVHAQVGPDDCMGWAGISHQRIRTSDLTIFGDIHCGFPLHEFPSGGRALSPGSLGRRSIADMRRPPQFLEIRIDKEGAVTVEHKQVPSLPDSEIFEDMRVEDSGEDTADIFKREWQKSFEAQDETPVERVRRIGKAFEHSDEEIGMVLLHLPQEVM